MLCVIYKSMDFVLEIIFLKCIQLHYLLCILYFFHLDTFKEKVKSQSCVNQSKVKYHRFTLPLQNTQSKTN